MKNSLRISVESIISRAVSFQQHFTTVTCWHFISTYFLSANFAVIFLFWLPLCSAMAQWSNGPSWHSVIAARGEQRLSRADREEEGGEGGEGGEDLSAAPAAGWKVRQEKGRGTLESFDHVSAASLSPHRASSDDQAPHLVYLTSCSWHSLYASVSLSNTPSEVSLVCTFWPFWPSVTISVCGGPHQGGEGTLWVGKVLMGFLYITNSPFLCWFKP